MNDTRRPTMQSAANSSLGNDLPCRDLPCRDLPCRKYHDADLASIRNARSLASVQLAYGRHDGPAGFRCRRAAVLILFMRVAQQWSLLLTKRPEHLRSHAGQICFPGGRIEAGETAIAAALREYREELGVESDAIRILGTLHRVFVYASNNLVTPVVGCIDGPIDFQPDAAEVQQVLLLPWPLPEDDSAWKRHEMLRPVRRDGSQIDRLSIAYHALSLGDHQIWGATATMIAELAKVGYQIG